MYDSNIAYCIRFVNIYMSTFYYIATLANIPPMLYIYICTCFESLKTRGSPQQITTHSARWVVIIYYCFTIYAFRLTPISPLLSGCSCRKVKSKLKCISHLLPLAMFHQKESGQGRASRQTLVYRHQVSLGGYQSPMG